MKLGMIVAVIDEINAMLTEMGEPIETITADGFEIRRYNVSGNDLYVAKSGAGEIYASAATQLLISKYGAELIESFGICGGLTTFSTFSLQVAELVSQGNFLSASLLFLGTFAACLAAAQLSIIIARRHLIIREAA